MTNGERSAEKGKREISSFHPLFAGSLQEPWARLGFPWRDPTGFEPYGSSGDTPFTPKLPRRDRAPYRNFLQPTLSGFLHAFWKPPSPPALWRGRRPAGDARTVRRARATAVMLQPLWRSGTLGTRGSPTLFYLPFLDLGLWGCSLRHQPGDPANISSRTGDPGTQSTCGRACPCATS